MTEDHPHLPDEIVRQLRYELAELAAQWKRTTNPVYVWQAIRACERIPQEYPAWVREYLKGCADRAVRASSRWPKNVRVPFSFRPPKDVNKALPRIFGFVKPARAKGGRGSYFSDAAAEEWDHLFATFFARAIAMGQDPVPAREAAFIVANALGITLTAEDIPSALANPYTITDPSEVPEDKELKESLRRHFGIKRCPKTTAAWKALINRWYIAHMYELIEGNPAPFATPDHADPKK